MGHTHLHGANIRTDRKPHFILARAAGMIPISNNVVSVQSKQQLVDNSFGGPFNAYQRGRKSRAAFNVRACPYSPLIINCPRKRGEVHQCSWCSDTACGFLDGVVAVTRDDFWHVTAEGVVVLVLHLLVKRSHGPRVL